MRIDRPKVYSPSYKRMRESLEVTRRLALSWGSNWTPVTLRPLACLPLRFLTSARAAEAITAEATSIGKVTSKESPADAGCQRNFIAPSSYVSCLSLCFVLSACYWNTLDVQVKESAMTHWQQQAHNIWLSGDSMQLASKTVSRKPWQLNFVHVPHFGGHWWCLTILTLCLCHTVQNKKMVHA